MPELIMPEIKGVIYDLDGTLVDSLPVWYEAIRLTMQYFGVDVSGDELVKRCFNRKAAEIVADKDLHTTQIAFSDRLNDNLFLESRSVRAFGGVIDTLEFFRSSKMQMAVVSYTDRWLVNRLIKYSGIGRYFNPVLAYEDVTEKKPHPEGVLTSCRTFGIGTKEALVVGDTIKDIKMAHAAGSTSVLFLPEGNRRFYDFHKLRQEASADCTITQFVQLRGIVEKRKLKH